MIKTYGRYRAEALIGQGAMGEVFRGRDPELDRVIAIKVLKPMASLPAAMIKEIRERFLREARAAAKLAHPNIVSIYDVGVSDDGCPFLILELVDGPSLDGVLEAGGPFSAKEAAAAGVALARALECAHRNGVIHRDVKPANTLRTQSGTVKLMDFGIARLDQSTLTAEGSFLGSPQFSSPEQIRGNPVTAASDIFSLGVTIYMLLAGRAPFARAKLAETVRAVVLEAAPPITSVRSDLDALWDAVLGRAMAKEPGARHPDAAGLADDFESLLRGRGVVAVMASASAAPPAPPELELVVIEGPDQGLRRALVESLEIGRGGGDFALSDGTVSTRHCRVELGGAGVRVLDHHSRNGTWVGGTRIESHELANGEIFTVGSSTRIRIETRLTSPSATGTVVNHAGQPAPPERHTVSLVLRVLDGALAGRRFPVDRDLVIGRDEGDIQLGDERASRKHAILELRGPGRVMVRDLASSNGTFLNTDRVRQVELQIGDELTIGSTRIGVESP